MAKHSKPNRCFNSMTNLQEAGELSILSGFDKQTYSVSIKSFQVRFIASDLLCGRS